MMSKKSPQLRFEGFTDDWEQRKLGDEFKKVNERNNGSFGREHWISVANMYFQDPEKVQSNNINTRTYVMRIGDMAFEGNKSSKFKYGRFVVNDIGNGVVSELFPIYRHNNEYDNSYWKNAIQIERIMAPIFAKAITSSGVSSNKLDNNHFLNQKICIPPLKEQKKIGSFFKQLDDTIALHQRKLDLLKEQKKGYLQKMFPKNGAKVPELRFAGFVDDWEQRKLSDLMTFSNGINAPKENYGKGTKMISVMDILNPLPIKYDNILNSVSVDKKIEDKNKVENGDLIFVRSSEIVEEVGWAKAYKEARYALYSGFAIRGKRISSYNAYFIELTLNYANRKEIKRRAGGSTRFNVSQEILNSLTVLTPSISEQNQIDLFFTKIDDTITLHQRKLDLLKEQKKGFLQKMFV
ncbi:restriction endonuclease subunit S [Lactococcus cremoris]|uniref:restriction endonuclease subunit S n=1 Tax=Lactococcus lactis subsp. cremoris TaxID=1359 RepID=UPI0022E29EAB|nr:restriction endonuclease subunit S [Lactococcus cremoris]MDA2882569.1 restriction endonuclease subunit S [Lactococcus cremoris]